MKEMVLFDFVAGKIKIRYFLREFSEKNFFKKI